MQPYPHHYCVQAAAQPEGPVALSSESLPILPTAPPIQFDGPGDHWSPETLLVGAVADCFVLTFRAIARASNLPWSDLQCRAVGTLDRVGGNARFTQIEVRAVLTVLPGTNTDKARRLLEKADKMCLVSNSLAFTPTLVSEVRTAQSQDIAG